MTKSITAVARHPSIASIVAEAREVHLQYVENCAQTIEFYRNGKLLAEKRIAELQAEIRRLGSGDVDPVDEVKEEPRPMPPLVVKVEPNVDDFIGFDEPAATDHDAEPDDSAAPSVMDYAQLFLLPTELECIDCKAIFPSTVRLEEHWKECDTREANFKASFMFDTSRMVRNIYGTFDCPIAHCKRQFEKAFAVNAHMKVHMPGYRYRYPCTEPNCPEKFNVKYKFKQHMRTHWLVNPLKCPEPGCDEVFTNDMRLKRHLVLHRGARPHQCEVCGSSFKMKNTLLRHKLIHSDDKPFVCEIEGCGKRFGRREHMREHMDRHPGESRLTCDWSGCTKTFKSKFWLDKHKRVSGGRLYFLFIYC